MAKAAKKAIGQPPSKKSPNPVDIHIGKRIRMARLLLSISQEKLGDALGLTFQQVQKYEKGTNRVGGSRMLQISKTLQVPVAYFYEGVPGGNAAASEKQKTFVDDFIVSAGGIDLAKAYVALPNDKMRRAIASLVETVAAEAE